MNVNLVADVGNTRVKWGVCALVEGKASVIRRASLENDAAAWLAQLTEWGDEFPLWKMAASMTWVVAGVHPEQRDGLVHWLRARGDTVTTLDKAAQLPIKVGVENPDHVGIDRLLNAVAAQKELFPGQPAILVDVGSAVTVDWLDGERVFRGGSIFPGVRLMAKALHDHTALLPEITVAPPMPTLPGRDTVTAMQTGVFWAVLGGIETIARRLKHDSALPPHLFLTGGDAEWLLQALDDGDPIPWLGDFSKTLWPEQTLEGLLLAAEALPA
jgi:type III pantothenate kinase